MSNSASPTVDTSSETMKQWENPDHSVELTTVFVDWERYFISER